MQVLGRSPTNMQTSIEQTLVSHATPARRNPPRRFAFSSVPSQKQSKYTVDVINGRCTARLLISSFLEPGLVTLAACRLEELGARRRALIRQPSMPVQAPIDDLDIASQRQKRWSPRVRTGCYTCRFVESSAPNSLRLMPPVVF